MTRHPLGAILAVVGLAWAVIACDESTSANPLPKGLELYSWVGEGGPFDYALLPGTNRIKMLSEVQAPATVIHSVRDLKQALAAQPRGTSVFWLSGAVGRVPGAEGVLILPSADVVQEIRTYCEGIGLPLELVAAE
jgi:hypothetical protein